VVATGAEADFFTTVFFTLAAFFFAEAAGAAGAVGAAGATGAVCAKEMPARASVRERAEMVFILCGFLFFPRRLFAERLCSLRRGQLLTPPEYSVKSASSRYYFTTGGVAGVAATGVAVFFTAVFFTFATFFLAEAAGADGAAGAAGATGAVCAKEMPARASVMVSAAMVFILCGFLFSFEALFSYRLC
jgi:hypothetical protein